MKKKKKKKKEKKKNKPIWPKSIGGEDDERRWRC